MLLLELTAVTPPVLSLLCLSRHRVFVHTETHGGLLRCGWMNINSTTTLQGRQPRAKPLAGLSVFPLFSPRSQTAAQIRVWSCFPVFLSLSLYHVDYFFPAASQIAWRCGGGWTANLSAGTWRTSILSWGKSLEPVHLCYLMMMFMKWELLIYLPNAIKNVKNKTESVFKGRQEAKIKQNSFSTLI